MAAVRDEVRNRFRQAEAELLAARDNVPLGHYSVAAFAAHQAAEMALKALIIHRHRRMPLKTHNLLGLAEDLGDVPDGVLSDLRLLNPEYAVSRYPAAANGVPAENYDAPKTQRIIEAAERVWQWAASALTWPA